MKKILFLLSLSIYISAYSQDTIHLKQVSVTGSYKATKQTPFTFQNIPSEQIQAISFGNDPAVVLGTTPSVTWYSDNGDGYGYTYWRLRGIDQTRLNSTLNGVPLNEPEDQGVYYNNYGGFLYSVSDIQIIRGTGLSKPGVSSYGGSINFNSLEFSKKFSGFANVIYGRDATRQINAGINTPHFFLTGSWGTNAGFKENSYNKSQSIFYGANFKVKNNAFYFYGFAGNQKNGMAWLGEPLDSLSNNPFYNANTKDEKDHFLQIHNQAIWQNGILKTTIYHTYLKGWYTTDMGHFDTTHSFGDLINTLSLHSNWVGAIINLNPTKKTLYTNLGISAYTYTRNHEGSYNKYNDEEPWYYAYKNDGFRKEIAPYAKAELKFKPISIYGDVQYRYTTFRYEGGNPMNTMDWNFFNWSAGVSLKISKEVRAYYGIGRTSREPTRSDLFLGSDDRSDSINNISPETALSNELGVKYNSDNFCINANLYYMNFKDEIVLNGKYGPNSLLLHQNAAKSFRSGLEIDAKYKTSIGFDFSTTTTFSYNRITQNGEKLKPVLSPAFLSNLDAVYNLDNFTYIGLNTRINGLTYIDFSNEHTIPAYAVWSIYGGITWKGFELKGIINNITGQQVINNAIIGFDGEPRYFATQFWYGSLSLTFKF